MFVVLGSHKQVQLGKMSQQNISMNMLECRDHSMLVETFVKGDLPPYFDTLLSDLAGHDRLDLFRSVQLWLLLYCPSEQDQLQGTQYEEAAHSESKTVYLYCIWVNKNQEITLFLADVSTRSFSLHRCSISGRNKLSNTSVTGSATLAGSGKMTTPHRKGFLTSTRWLQGIIILLRTPLHP